MLRSPHFTSSTNVPPSSIPPVATTWSNLFQGAALRSFRGLGKLCSLQPYQRLWKGIENCLRNLFGGIPPKIILAKKHKKVFSKAKTDPFHTPHQNVYGILSSTAGCELNRLQLISGFGLQSCDCHHNHKYIMINAWEVVPL